ncbi:hypothetical protein [Altererythrobacter sp. GH1-8]|uniref:hypothetical protein n=1 Tax=Altererythrobacter sp. GH1-8 TaxID=3349333 RepID=UPI00374DE28B
MTVTAKQSQSYMYDLPRLPGWVFDRAPRASPGVGLSDEAIYSSDENYSVRRLGRSSETLLVAFQVGVEFEVSFGARRIALTHAAPHLPENTIRHLLIDQLVPRVIAQLGSLVVHASAVKVGNKAALFLGDTGQGKSTLAASFMMAGHELICDDALCVEWSAQKPVAAPVFQDLRLNSDSIESIFPNAPATTTVAHYSSKRHVAVAPDICADEGPFPIASIFMLAPAATGPTRVDRLVGGEACMALVQHSFLLDPQDIQNAAKRLKHCEAIAQSIGVFKVSYKKQFAKLPELRNSILTCLKTH